MLRTRPSLDWLDWRPGPPPYVPHGDVQFCLECYRRDPSPTFQTAYMFRLSNRTWREGGGCVGLPVESEVHVWMS